jgi:hypothetical protein
MAGEASRLHVGEKADTTYGDLSPTAYSNSSDEEDGTDAELKRIRMKLDFRLVVLVGFMYCVSLMDRSNLANANTAGYVVSMNIQSLPFRMGCPRIEKDSPAALKLKKSQEYCIGSQGLNLVGFRYVCRSDLQRHTNGDRTS